ncbi:unnamed protein product, partial [Amoebophrya sp. A120]|eukprot:GSA120T00024952001.1
MKSGCGDNKPDVAMIRDALLPLMLYDETERNAESEKHLVISIDSIVQEGEEIPWYTPYCSWEETQKKAEELARKREQERETAESSKKLTEKE